MHAHGGGEIPRSYPHTFICHASADREKADQLVGQLEANGIGCWIAHRDGRSGQRYAPALLQAIHACHVLVVVFSGHTPGSPHVPNEIENAVSRGKPILLIRTDATDPNADEQISLFVTSRNWFDAAEGSFADHLPRIADDIRDLIGGNESVLVPPPIPPPSNPAAQVGAQPTPSPPGPELSLGIEIGATKIRGCVVDLSSPSAELPAANRYFEPAEEPATARSVLDQTKAMLERMIAEHCRDTKPVGIGIAAPGQVDVRVGTLKFAPNLFSARNISFKNYLSSVFPGVPVRVDNEVRCATRFELHLGSGSDFEDFVCVFIGTGVGSGTVVGRRIYFGHNYCAGEVGHIKISTTGPPCACGQIGCLETFVNAKAVVSRAAAKAIDFESREMNTVLATSDRQLTPKDVAEAIEQGDPAAKEVIDEIAEDLGLGIANYLNLFNPAAMIVGGGIMSGFFFHMTEGISRTVQGNALAEVANTQIVQAAHSEESIATGAALLFYPADDWPF